MRKRFQIFRRGTHIASDGTKRTYTDSDLKGLVKAYDPKKMTSPLVFGHPAMDTPAHGAMVAVEYDEASGKLFGDFEHVHEDIVKQLDDRRWLAGSLSLYTEDNPNNPVPGVLYPKHFGLLGSTPPAVKGMDGLLAHADDDGALTVEFGEESGIQKVLSAIADFLSKDYREEKDKKPYGDVPYADPEDGKYPIDTEEHVRAAWSYINMPKNAAKLGDKLGAVKGRIKAAAKKFGITINEKDHQEDSMKLTAAEIQAAIEFAEKEKAKKMKKDEEDDKGKKKDEEDDKGKKKDEEDDKGKKGDDEDDDDKKEYAELKKQNASLKARLDAIDADKKSAEKANLLQHVEGLVKEGRVLPTFKAPLVQILEGMPTTAGSLEYGEGDAKVVTNPRAFLLDFLSKGVKQFSEGREKLGALASDSAKNFNGPKGMKVDPAGLEMHNAILAYQATQKKAGRELSYADAAIEASSLS